MQEQKEKKICPLLTGFLVPAGPQGIVPGPGKHVSVKIVNQQCIADACMFWDNGCVLLRKAANKCGS